MTRSVLDLVVPGPLDQRTGGYLYDARMVAGLRARGWTVRVHELPGRFPDADARARAALSGTLEALPDHALVVLDGLAMGLLPDVLEAAAGRVGVVGLVHHPLAEETGLDPRDRTRFRDLERRTLAACAGVVVTSPFTAERLGDYDVPASRIRVVVPGTEPALPARGPEPGEPPCLVSVGTVTPRKGQDVLVRALSLIRDLRWRCVCAGALDRDPRFAQDVRLAVSDAGLQDRVTLAGELGRAELDSLYDSATLFVLPSHYEGYGMALTEALARSLPVVSTTGGAIPHTVPDEAGVLVAPGDEAALAGALRALLADGERRDALRAGAWVHGAALPDWEESVDAFAEAVRALAPEGTA